MAQLSSERMEMWTVCSLVFGSVLVNESRAVRATGGATDIYIPALQHTGFSEASFYEVAVMSK